eukprot:scpid88561/ scgid22059/ 
MAFTNKLLVMLLSTCSIMSPLTTPHPGCNSMVFVTSTSFTSQQQPAKYMNGLMVAITKYMYMATGVRLWKGTKLLYTSASTCEYAISPNNVIILFQNTSCTYK